MSDTHQTNSEPGSDASALEPQEWIVATFTAPPPPEEQPQPQLPRRRRWLLPLCLFLGPCLSTYLIGGPIYSLALMTILVCHEAGHFLQARRYHVPASFPFFIPLPIPPIGTIGAVIGMSPNIPNRRALFDIGITGPLAGLVPTMICVVWGLHLSYVDVVRATPFVRALGEPLLLKALASLTFGPIPNGQTVYLHPLGVAGWVGLLITSLNLFPIGQLDGGHVLYALLRTAAHRIATFLLVGAAVCVVASPALWPWTLMLVLLTFMGPKHPPTRNDAAPLGTWRVVLGWLTLAFLPLGFTPFPFL